MDFLINRDNFGRDDNTLEYISVDNNVLTHKQIEFRQGLVFMRMKKRLFAHE